MPASRRTVEGPTERQLSFLSKLRSERGIDDDIAPDSKRQASQWIDELLKTPREVRPAAPVAVDLVEGMYRGPDGSIVKVQRSGQGRLYGKALVESETVPGSWRFDYMPGLISPALVALTLDEAKAFGCETGTCCVCGRELTNQASVAAGIGPVCASRF